MTFQKQKESILKFYEDTSDYVGQHKDTYSKLVIKLNEKEGLTQTLNNNLDDFMGHSFATFSTFKTQIESQPLEDIVITHVYDMNKKAYVPGFTLPDKKIIVKQNFHCKLMNGSNIVKGNPTGRPATVESITHKPTLQNETNYISNSYATLNEIRDNGICGHSDFTNSSSQCCNTSKSTLLQMIYSLGNTKILYKKEITNLQIYIDNYFNLYIPELKTYIVFNYSKFPLYAFYINLDKLNLYHNHIEGTLRGIMFNDKNPNDLAEYNLVKSFVGDYADFQTSEDKRNTYKGLFENLFKFYKYNEKQSYFAQYQSVAEKLESLNPSSSIAVIEEDSMDDELKIFAQSKRIRELEITTQKQAEEIEYLRNERIVYIENESATTIQLQSYKTVLEELNTELHNEIDKFSIQHKEVIKLKTINMEVDTLKGQLRVLEDMNGSIKTELGESIEKLSTLKTLNATLIDKQLESSHKVKLERDTTKKCQEQITFLKLKIEEDDKAMKGLERLVSCEKEQHQLSKSRIDELLHTMNTDVPIVEDNYQDILLSQLKEKGNDITELTKINVKLTETNELKNKEFNLLKSQVSALLNK
jgi:hypothetical protein